MGQRYASSRRSNGGAKFLWPPVQDRASANDERVNIHKQGGGRGGGWSPGEMLKSHIFVKRNCITIFKTHFSPTCIPNGVSSFGMGTFLKKIKG